ncbi:MAG: nodulation protein NfeD [Bacteroidota bacterium]|jgi:membrane-bound serine protease (ClpP class)|nr:nodulation protein NfeD [Bacteroidota bacterium]
MRHPIRIVLAILFCLLPLAASAQPRVLRIVIDGSINPASAKYIHDAVATAGADGYAALVVELNTPGGLLPSTREIVSDFLSAKIPVIVHVAPAGGQAASAGAFIAMAAHIAAMAPGTNIGAAHPVTLGEGADNIADSTNIPLTKATNDAAAFARTIAEQRGRNVAWAEQAVRGSVSATESEALRLGVIDLVAGDLRALLDAIDGRMVRIARDSVMLRTAHAVVHTEEMSFQQQLLDTLSDPNIAYILLMLGMYGLFFELYNPGAILPGVVGGICLILGFYSMNTLPINEAGLALIILAIILFILEIKIVSHGVLSVGGVIALFLGSIMLIESPPGAEFLEVSLSVIIAVTVCTTAFFLLVVGKGIAVMKRRPTTGVAGMIGEHGRVLVTLAPTGRVAVHGEIWYARAVDGATIPEDTQVRVVRVEQLTLVVEIM